MKTIAAFYERETEENFSKPKKIIKMVCETTTEQEHYKIRNAYLENKDYNKALSFCWWLEDKEADRIAMNHFETMLNALEVLATKEQRTSLTEPEKELYVHLYELLHTFDVEIPFGIEV